MRAVTKVFVIVAGLITGLLGPVVPAGAATGCAEIGSGNNFDPGLVSMSDGTVDVYKTGLTGTTSRAQVDPRTNTVLGAQPLGGTSRSEPGAVSWGPGHSAVFIAGGDNTLQYLQFTNGVSSGWLSLGGVVTYNPHPVALGPGHLIVFYRGSNKQLWFREFQNGAWGPHTSLGGVLTSSPIGVSTIPGHVGVFTRGQAGDLYYVERVGGVWSAWVGLGGGIIGDQIAVSRGPGLIDTFVRGSNSRVYKISANGSFFTPYQDLGAPPGGALSEPGAAATGSGELVVFVRGDEPRTNTRPLYRNSSFDGGATWSGWIFVDNAGAPSPNNPEAVANAFGGWSFAATNFPRDARVGPTRFCSFTP